MTVTTWGQPSSQPTCDPQRVTVTVCGKSSCGIRDLVDAQVVEQPALAARFGCGDELGEAAALVLVE